LSLTSLFLTKRQSNEFELEIRCPVCILYKCYGIRPLLLTFRALVSNLASADMKVDLRSPHSIIDKFLSLLAISRRLNSEKDFDVLLNLITNASKYSGAQTSIEVGVAHTRSRVVRITVADRGPGVSAEAARQIFEPYQRGGRTDGDGLGIGLSVVRSIVEAHGGRVGVKKRRSGGSIFWFELSSIGGGQADEFSGPGDAINTDATRALAKVEGGMVG